MEPDGFLVLDKPAGWTSHDVVARARRLLRTRKVGHAGTLDPMATGVLVLGVGRSTRLLTYVVGADKTYLATIRLGQTTLTDDAEGEILASADASSLDPGEVSGAVARLTGAIRQVPSAVSAIKVNGVRSYARVRSGEAVELAARPVTVSEFTVLDRRPALAEDGTAVLDLDVRVTCSSGTYVRALARDLGAALGVGGHLTALRRTRVGGYPVESALTLAEAADLAEGGAAPNRLAAHLLAPGAAAGAVMATRVVDDVVAADLGHGRWISPTGASGPVAVLDAGGRLLAVVQDTAWRGEPCARPVIVLT